jgi:hypothetical protein
MRLYLLGNLGGLRLQGLNGNSGRNFKLLLKARDLSLKILGLRVLGNIGNGKRAKARRTRRTNAPLSRLCILTLRLLTSNGRDF